jgi:hypothetical protein
MRSEGFCPANVQSRHDPDAGFFRKSRESRKTLAESDEFTRWLWSIGWPARVGPATIRLHPLRGEIGERTRTG